MVETSILIMELQEINTSLGLLKSYFLWMYYSTGGVESFNKITFIDKESGKTLSLSINEDGCYVLTETESGILAIYSTAIYNDPRRKLRNDGFLSLENYKVVAKIDNEFEIPDELLGIFKRMLPTIGNIFHRVVAFSLFASMDDTNLKAMSKDISVFIKHYSKEN